MFQYGGQNSISSTSRPGAACHYSGEEEEEEEEEATPRPVNGQWRFGATTTTTTTTTGANQSSRHFNKANGGPLPSSRSYQGHQSEEDDNDAYREPDTVIQASPTKPSRSSASLFSARRNSTRRLRRSPEESPEPTVDLMPNPDMVTGLDGPTDLNLIEALVQQHSTAGKSSNTILRQNHSAAAHFPPPVSPTGEIQYSPGFERRLVETVERHNKYFGQSTYGNPMNRNLEEEEEETGVDLLFQSTSSYGGAILSSPLARSTPRVLPPKSTLTGQRDRLSRFEGQDTKLEAFSEINLGYVGNGYNHYDGDDGEENDLGEETVLPYQPRSSPPPLPENNDNFSGFFRSRRIVPETPEQQKLSQMREERRKKMEQLSMIQEMSSGGKSLAEAEARRNKYINGKMGSTTMGTLQKDVTSGDADDTAQSLLQSNFGAPSGKRFSARTQRNLAASRRLNESRIGNETENDTVKVDWFKAATQFTPAPYNFNTTEKRAPLDEQRNGITAFNPAPAENVRKEQENTRPTSTKPPSTATKRTFSARTENNINARKAVSAPTATTTTRPTSPRSPSPPLPITPATPAINLRLAAGDESTLDITKEIPIPGTPVVIVKRSSKNRQTPTPEAMAANENNIRDALKSFSRIQSPPVHARVPHEQTNGDTEKDKGKEKEDKENWRPGTPPGRPNGGGGEYFSYLSRMNVASKLSEVLKPSLGVSSSPTSPLREKPESAAITTTPSLTIPSNPSKPPTEKNPTIEKSSQNLTSTNSTASTDTTRGRQPPSIPNSISSRATTQTSERERNPLKPTDPPSGTEPTTIPLHYPKPTFSETLRSKMPSRDRSRSRSRSPERKGREVEKTTTNTNTITNTNINTNTIATSNSSNNNRSKITSTSHLKRLQTDAHTSAPPATNNTTFPKSYPNSAKPAIPSSSTTTATNHITPIPEQEKSDPKQDPLPLPRRRDSSPGRGGGVGDVLGGKNSALFNSISDSDSTVDSIEGLLANDTDYGSLLGAGAFDKKTTEDKKVEKHDEAKGKGDKGKATASIPTINTAETSSSKPNVEEADDDSTYQISTLLRKKEDAQKRLAAITSSNLNTSKNPPTKSNKIEDTPEFQERLEQEKIALLTKYTSRLQTLELEFKDAIRGLGALEKRLDAEGAGGDESTVLEGDSRVFDDDSDEENEDDSDAELVRKLRRFKQQKAKLARSMSSSSQLRKRAHLPLKSKILRKMPKPYTKLQRFLLWTGGAIGIAGSFFLLETYLFISNLPPPTSRVPVHDLSFIPWGYNILNLVRSSISWFFEGWVGGLARVVWFVLRWGWVAIWAILRGLGSFVLPASSSRGNSTSVRGNAGIDAPSVSIVTEAALSSSSSSTTAFSSEIILNMDEDIILSTFTPQDTHAHTYTQSPSPITYEYYYNTPEPSSSSQKSSTKTYYDTYGSSYNNVNDDTNDDQELSFDEMAQPIYTPPPARDDGGKYGNEEGDYGRREAERETHHRRGGDQRAYRRMEEEEEWGTTVIVI